MGDEQKLVDEIRSLRDILDAADAERQAADGRRAQPMPRDRRRRRAGSSRGSAQQLREKFDALEARDPEKRMIYAHVDEQAVASVVSDWTGIPVGRMVQATRSRPCSSLPKSSTAASSASPTA